MNARPPSRPVGGQGRERDETIVLVHGIWMHGMAMRGLAYLLERHGFRTHTVSYDFLRASPAENAEKLCAELRALGRPGVHLMGHSLGGLVVLHLLSAHPELDIGRVVLLGSPVKGSRVAQRVHAKAWLRPLLGRSVEQGLLGGAPGHDGRVELGVITGHARFGLSALLYPADNVSDGVVAEVETELENALEHVSLPRSHSAMLFSRTCAEHVARFVRTGTFRERDDEDGDSAARSTPARDTPARDTPARDTPARDTPAQDASAPDTP